MRRLLLNNQPESRSRAMLKTRRPNAVARILTALFVMLLIPQGLLAGSKPYAFTSTSQTPGDTGPSLVNFQTSEGTSWVLSGASSGGGGNLEFTLYKNGTLTSVEEFYKVSKITIQVGLTIAQENAPAPYAKFSCNQIQYQIDYFTSQGGDVVLETGDFYPNGPLTIDVEAEDCIVTLYSITVEYDKENWLPNNLTYNGTDPFVINWSGKEGALFPQIGYMDLINPETASEEFCILTDEQLSKIDFSSSDENVAIIDEAGNITILNPGSTTIDANFHGSTRYYGTETWYTLTVNDDREDWNLSYSAPTATVIFGTENYELPTLSNAMEPMEYSSSDPSVAEINGEGDVTIKTIGTTVIKAKFLGDDIYKPDSVSYDLTVKAPAPTLAFDPTTATYTFGGEFAKPVLSNPNKVAVTYSSTNTAVATINASGDITAVAAGTTTIKATYAGDATHEGAEASYTLTVKNGASAVATTPVAIEGLLFTGSAQALVTAGMATNGTMQYSLDNTTWGNDVPTGTNAGDYTVYYKVKGNANYNDANGGSIPVTIGKMAAPTLTFNPTAATYTFGEAFAKPTLNNPSNVAVTYSSTNKAVATVNASGDITAVAAGETTIKATYAGDDNHTGKKASYTLTVENGASAVATAPVAIEGLLFTGSAQALVTAGTATNGTMQYSLDNKTWGNDVPTGTNAGNYTVYYKVKGNANFNDAAGNSIPVTINKAAGSISYAKTTINKMEGDDTFTNKLTYSGDGAVTYTSKDKTVATVNASGVVTILKAGTTTITATVADGTNYTYATKTATYTLNVERAIVKYDLWIGTTQVTEDNLNNVLGDNDKTFQYFPTVNKLFITNSNGQSIESRINEGLTIYLAPSSNNKLQKIVSTVAAPLTITTDGNYPGGLELETTDGNVIEGFSSLSLEQNLSILKPDNVKYLNNALTASKGIIGIVIETMVEEEKVSLDDQELKDNPLMNYVYNDKVLMTLNNTQDPDGDGWDDSGTPGIVLNSAVSDEVFDLLNMDETAPGTQKFAEIFTGLTILIPGGEGLINIDAETHDGYCIKLKSLFGDELKKEMTTNEERTVQTFNYKFDAPTFVGIYNGGKSGNAARNKMIRPGRKTVTHIKIYNATISPGKVNAANPAGAASGGLYTGPVPAVGQDVENPTEITTGIKDVEHSTFNIEHATGKWYNLNGQQINEPSMKGLYIRNGKKIMIK